MGHCEDLERRNLPRLVWQSDQANSFSPPCSDELLTRSSRRRFLHCLHSFAFDLKLDTVVLPIDDLFVIVWTTVNSVARCDRLSLLPWSKTAAFLARKFSPSWFQSCSFFAAEQSPYWRVKNGRNERRFIGEYVELGILPLFSHRSSTFLACLKKSFKCLRNLCFGGRRAGFDYQNFRQHFLEIIIWNVGRAVDYKCAAAGNFTLFWNC